MRKIYFILFAVVLVVLIVLVDWREKWHQITGASQADPLGEILPADAENLSVGTELPPMEDFVTEGADNLTTDQLSLPENLALPEPALANSPPGFSAPRPANPFSSRLGLPGVAGPAARRAPPKPAAPRPFEDVPDQPYRDESRRLLNSTMSHYRRISPPQPEQQP